MQAFNRLKLVGLSERSFIRPGLQVSLKDATLCAELLAPRDGGMSYNEIELGYVDARLFSVPVQVASIAALISMKSLLNTARPPISSIHLES